MTKRAYISILCFSIVIVSIFLIGLVSVIVPHMVVSGSILFRMYLVEYSVRFFGINYLVIAIWLGTTLWLSFIKKLGNYSRYVLTFVPIILIIGQYFSMLYDGLNASFYLPFVVFFIVLSLSGFFLAKEYIK